MKKVKKNIGKAFRKKRFKKYFKKAWKELKEEAEDFYEDFFEKKEVHKKLRKVKLHGTNILVKPAYVFAQRIEGLMHFIIGSSIFVSSLMATFWGFTRTSELLTALINSIYGRIVMVIIGFSYFVLGIWKMFNLGK